MDAGVRSAFVYVIEPLHLDMSHELRPSGVTVVSLYPGLVRTEAVMQAARSGWLDVSNSESPEFIGNSHPRAESGPGSAR
jgi:NAD(P)-dependent dehydrogenase (short-subunit alcohol dehydrogenase family)